MELLTVGALKTRFSCGVEGIAKTMFSQKLCFGVSRVDFLCFLEGLGVLFLIFFCLGNRLEN